MSMHKPPFWAPGPGNIVSRSAESLACSKRSGSSQAGQASFGFPASFGNFRAETFEAGMSLLDWGESLESLI